MKTPLPCCLTAVLLVNLALAFSPQPARADMLPAPPPQSGAERPNRQQRHSIPLYSVGAGVVAVALTGSFVTLRVLRKRNGK